MKKRCQEAGFRVQGSGFGVQVSGFSSLNPEPRTLAVLLLFACLCLPSTHAAEPADFDGSAWYQPYGQVLRVDYRISDKAWAAAQGQPSQVSIRVEASDGKSLFKQVFPVERTVPSPGAKSYERTDVTKRQFKQPLPEGSHTAILQLQAADGAILHSTNQVIVVRKHAFEHNAIGQERVVIPPFEPITAQGNRATLWGREITFAASGLPERIMALGQDLLAPGGVRLLLKTGAQTVEPRAAGPALVMTAPDGHDAVGSSTGTLGALSYRFTGRLEYEGAYFMHLEIDGGDRETPVDSLTLLIPFAGGADTFSFQKNDRDINSSGGYSRFGGIVPSQQGVIFDARRLPMASAYGGQSENYFVPAIYVGSGTRGLWYYADSDWDWYLNPANEHATLERVDGRVQLRVLLVNDAVVWKGKRVFDVVLMPQPVKPMSVGWRKVAWGYPDAQYVHDTAGWRYYGDGVNAFTLPTDDDYRQLGRVFAGEAPRPAEAYGGTLMKPRGDSRPLVLYGSSLMAGSGVANGEWASYAAEWVDPDFARRPTDPEVKARFQRFTSYGGYDWEADISFKPCAVQWTDSWLDFALFYQQKLVSLAGANGTWFDNQSTFTIVDFDEQGLDRHLIENPQRFPTGVPLAQRPFNYGRRYHTLQFRRYLKRLSTMCHTAGVQPFWLVNQHPTWSFAQMAWHIEGDYYCQKTERDLVEHMGVAGFRAHVRSQGGLIARLQAHAEMPDQPAREGHVQRYGVRTTDSTSMLLPGRQRTHMGLCLLHDVGMLDADRLTMERLDRAVGFFDEGLAFLPYWEQTMATVDSDRVYVSVFRNPARKQALAVVFNEKKAAKGLTVSLRIPASTQVRDLETGEPLVDLDGKAPGLQTQFYVPPRDFRLLVWPE